METDTIFSLFGTSRIEVQITKALEKTDWKGSRVKVKPSIREPYVPVRMKLQAYVTNFLRGWDILCHHKCLFNAFRILDIGYVKKKKLFLEL